MRAGRQAGRQAASEQQRSTHHQVLAGVVAGVPLDLPQPALGLVDVVDELIAVVVRAVGCGEGVEREV
jgi:hypothetical protein